MELTNREHVVLGVRGMLLEALHAEGQKGCDPTVHQEPVSLIPSYSAVAVEQILDGKRLLPLPVRAEQSDYSEHFSVAFHTNYSSNEQLFSSVLHRLISLQKSISVEVASTGQQIAIQISTSRHDASLVESSFAMLDNVELVWTPDLLVHQKYSFLDLAPVPPYFRALTTLSENRLTSGFLKAILPHVHSSVIQFIFQPLPNGWRENFSSCLELEKKLQSVDVHPAFEYTALTKSQYKSAVTKSIQPLFAVAVRIASTEKRALNNLASLFNNYWYGEQPFRVISDAAYPYPDIISNRQIHRNGMILAADELASFIELPSPELVKRYKLYHVDSNAVPNDLLLGYTNDRPVQQRYGSRTRHTAIVGKTGKGKSTLLLNMIEQDIQHGEGVGVIDPHGDLLNDVLKLVPKHRVNDVVYLSPVESQTLGFGLFQLGQDEHRGKLADDLVYCFQNAFTSWGERMEAIFRQCFYALFTLENSCLADLRTLLSKDNSSLRNRLLPLLSNEEAVQFWTEDFHQYHHSAFDPILNKMSKFLLNEYLGSLFRQRTNLLDFRSIINDGKILLINLPTGAVGTNGVDLLGGLFITALYHACLSRASLAPSQRRPFYLYVDEFQRFSTRSTEDILREARKYNLGLVVAFQQFGNLREEINVALNNADSLIAFDLGLDDAKKFVKLFPGLDVQDLQQKGVGEAWSILNNDLVRFQTVVHHRHGDSFVEEILNLSLERYYTQIVPDTSEVHCTGVPYDEI